MAEYIDRDALFKHYMALANIEWNKTVAPVSWCDAYEEIADHIAELPPADVVPKSEVVNILDELMKEAREISTRYEKSANETSDYDYARIEYRGCQMGALIVSFKIAELKKKYT